MVDDIDLVAAPGGRPSPASGCRPRAVRDETVRGPRWNSEDCTAEPLAPSADDSALDGSGVPAVSIPNLVDIDGDGSLDLVDIGKSAKVLRFGGSCRRTCLDAGDLCDRRIHARHAR
jgi:hypothetical protein